MTSRFDPIPNSDPSGLLPPFVGSPTSGGQRSPYPVGLTDVVLRFGDTSARRKLLTGFLDYRAALHTAGMREGFQWINGSFVEDTMHRYLREPKDIDVVPFFRCPRGQTQAQLVQANPSLFAPGANRRQYCVDAYTVVLEIDDLPYLVRRTAYWSSLWSHDRSYRWKGYLEISLSDSEDVTARAALDRATTQEVEE